MNYVKGGSPYDFRNSVMTIVENYPKPSVDVLMNSISTHDIERAINVLGGESCEGKSKDWMSGRMLTAEEYELGRNRMKVAMALQYFLPGVPCIYYATRPVSRDIRIRSIAVAISGAKRIRSC